MSPGSSPSESGSQVAESQGARFQTADSSSASAPSTASPAPPTPDLIAGALPPSPIAAATGSALAAATPKSASLVTSTTLDDLAGQTAAQVNSGASQFQITLNPDGLGQVSVTVNVGAEGKVSAAFAFERPETAEALSGRASDLQKSLEQAGFTLSDAGLSFSMATPASHGQGADQGGQTPNQGQNPGGGFGQGSGGQGSGGQGSNGQGSNGQGSNGQGSGQTFAQGSGQSLGQGSGQPDGGGQGQAWSYNQTAGRAFAFANEAASAADQSSNSGYASRSSSGLDIRI
jgi:hypothetical protein